MTRFRERDIVQYTWGYGQTNQNFFEVIKRTAKTVLLRELETKTTRYDGSGKEAEYKDMEGLVVPIPGKYRDGPLFTPQFRKRVFNAGQDYEEIRFEFGWAKLWDGTPQRESWGY